MVLSRCSGAVRLCGSEGEMPEAPLFSMIALLLAAVQALAPLEPTQKGILLYMQSDSADHGTTASTVTPPKKSSIARK